MYAIRSYYALSALQPILDKIDNNSNLLALAGEVFMQNGDAERNNFV